MSTTEVVVLGAGMVGICTALCLQQRGHTVVVVDRKSPGRETSYGNAGLIQREAVQPYAFPRDIKLFIRAATGQGNDVHYHWRAIPQLAPRLARYWQNSAPAPYRPVVQAFSQLIEHCLSEHKGWLQQANATDLLSQRGWMKIYRQQAAFDTDAATYSKVAAEFDLAVSMLDSQALAQAEPCLTRPLAGAIHWSDPWAISNPGELVSRYARLFERQGGRIVDGNANTLIPTAHGWQVNTADGHVEAAHAVIALGPWADQLTQQLGYKLPLFVKRGYHRHYQMEQYPSMAMLDVENGVMMAPMQQGLRLTTGAEFATQDAPPTPVQLHHAERTCAELLNLGQPIEAEPWLGARPCTVDMKPIVGAAGKHPNLWFNFGHGHQGFTLGPVTGRLIAELISGQRPFIDVEPYSPLRFG